MGCDQTPRPVLDYADARTEASRSGYDVALRISCSGRLLPRAFALVSLAADGSPDSASAAIGGSRPSAETIRDSTLIGRNTGRTGWARRDPFQPRAVGLGLGRTKASGPGASPSVLVVRCTTAVPVLLYLSLPALPASAESLVSSTRRTRLTAPITSAAAIGQRPQEQETPTRPKAKSRFHQATNPHAR